MTRVIDIIIVNWNGGDALAQCIASIKNHENGFVRRVVVVDNASTDGSVETLSLTSEIEFKVFCNSENRGFGKACNQGARDSESEYILFLNPDAVLRSDSLAPVVAFMSDPKNAKVGIVGAKLIDEYGKTQRSCARFPTSKSIFIQAAGLDRIAPRLFHSHFILEWDHEDIRSVDQVMGAFLMIRRSLFEELGGFDERFFVYYEDVDLCLRVHQRGFEVVHLPEAVAVHRGCGTTAAIPDTRLFLLWRSRILYAGKHFSRLALVWVLLATLAVEPAVRVIYAYARWRPFEALAVGRAFSRIIHSMLS